MAKRDDHLLNGLRAGPAETRAGINDRLRIHNLSDMPVGYPQRMAKDRLGGRIREIPIRFVDREAGASKMERGIAIEAMRLVPTLRFRGAQSVG